MLFRNPVTERLPCATWARGNVPFVTSFCLTGLVVMKGGADLFHVGSMRADRFMELGAGDTELLGPIGDVGGHLGIDLF
jgi:hypothetical protein